MGSDAGGSDQRLSEQRVEVFTTRLDTIYGATYLALAAEHPLVQSLAGAAGREDEVLEFVRAFRQKDGLIQTVEGSATLAVMANEPGTVTLSDAVVGDQSVNGSGNLVDLVFRRVGIVTASSVEIDSHNSKMLLAALENARSIR